MRLCDIGGHAPQAVRLTTFGHGMPCVKEGEVIAGDRLGNVDWFVNGLIGQPM